MTKSKTQLRGHCQCCGRQQAVRGAIAQHGYTVQNGWFEGVCSGHIYAPIEESRVRADEVVAAVRASVAELRAKAGTALTGGCDPETYKSGYHYVQEPQWKCVEEFSPFADASEFTKADIRDSISRNLLGKAQAGEQFADFLAGLVEKVHGKPLVVVVKSEPAPRIYSDEKRISVKGSVLVIVRNEGRRIWYRREGQSGIFAITPRAWRLLPLAVENNSQPNEDEIETPKKEDEKAARPKKSIVLTEAYDAGVMYYVVKQITNSTQFEIGYKISPSSVECLIDMEFGKEWTVKIEAGN